MICRVMEVGADVLSSAVSRLRLPVCMMLGLLWSLIQRDTHCRRRHNFGKHDICMWCELCGLYYVLVQSEGLFFKVNMSTCHDYKPGISTI